MRIADGRYACASVLELLRVPHVDVLREPDQASVEVFDSVRNEFALLLGELFQLQRALIDEQAQVELSTELLFVSIPVSNQPHAAEVRMLLCNRTLAPTERLGDRVAEEATAICLAALDSVGVDSTRLDYDEYRACWESVSPESGLVLLKREQVVELNAPAARESLVYPVISTRPNNMSRIVGTLVNSPNCAVSIQLLPTTYTAEEAQYIAAASTIFTSMSQGVPDQSAGSISVVPARMAATVFEYYEVNKTGPLFNMNVLVRGDSIASSVLAGRIHGHLSDTSDTTPFSSRTMVLPSGAIEGSLAALPWRLADVITEARQRFGGLGRLPSLVTAQEASQLFRTPIADESVGAGFTVSRSRNPSRHYRPGVIDGVEIAAGILNTPSKGVTVGFSKEDLTKHMFVVGTPCSGKTTFTLGLLDRLWKEHGIPFLVIEPAKTEYRGLLHSIPDLQVFTPGKSSISPFILNPFLPPSNVPLESYKSSLQTAFSAAVTMTSPLDRIFEEAMDLAYSQAGWLNDYTNANGAQVINIGDFLMAFTETFERIGYSGDAQNIGRAGIVRLGSLERHFDTYKSIPVEDLLARPTLIELAAIENTDAKALIIALVLLQVLAYVNANVVGDGHLRNVLLLEEAHVLLGSQGRVDSSGEADPTRVAQGLVQRMLAEVRSAGLGMIIADQSARAVGMDVVALTNIKMCFRLVERSDREIVGASANMTEMDQARLATLRPGEALLYYEKLDEPEEIATRNYRAENSIPISISDEDVARLGTYWREHHDLLLPFPECHLVPDFDPQLNPVAKEIATRVYRELGSPQNIRADALAGLYRRTGELVRRLTPPEYADLDHLRLAVHVHLLRLLRYKGGAPISPDLAARTLTNLRTS